MCMSLDKGPIRRRQKNVFTFLSTYYSILGPVCILENLPTYLRYTCFSSWPLLLRHHCLSSQPFLHDGFGLITWCTVCHRPFVRTPMGGWKNWRTFAFFCVNSRQPSSAASAESKKWWLLWWQIDGLYVYPPPHHILICLLWLFGFSSFLSFVLY